MGGFEVSQLAGLLAMLLFVSGFAGVIAGLLGVGGGIVLVPAFYYTFSVLGFGGGQLMQVCVATSLATIVFTSMRSIASHQKKGAVDWVILKNWAPGMIIAAVIGVFVARELKSETLTIVFGVLELIVGLYMAFGKSSWRIADQMPGLVVRSILSPLLGFFSVLMGIGGGSFGVPIMTLYGVPIHRAVATAAGFGLIIAVPSVIGFTLIGHEITGKPPFTFGYVNLLALVIVVSMTLITAPWGVKLAHRMDPKPLKFAFAIFLILVALNMLRKAIWA